MRTCLLLCILLPFVSWAQTYKRAKKTSDEEFVHQVFPNLKTYESIYSGDWGGSHKILVTYLADDDFNQAYLLSQVKNRTYELIDFPFEFGIGVYPRTSSIDTVFFQDFNNDKVIDLLVIENGIWRCHVEIEEENEETGEIEIFESSASCDVCAYSVFTIKNGKVDLLAGEEDIDWNCDISLMLEDLQRQIEEERK